MRRFTDFFRSLFGRAVPADKHSEQPPEETDGSEVLFPLAAIAIQPSAGWLVVRPNLPSQKETNTQICHPVLWSQLGTITAMVFPADGLTSGQQAEAYAARSSGAAMESEEIHSESGIPIVRLSIRDKLKTSGADALIIAHFLANQRGRVVMIYFAGEPNAALQASEMIIRTLKHGASGV